MEVALGRRQSFIGFKDDVTRGADASFLLYGNRSLVIRETLRLWQMPHPIPYQFEEKIFFEWTNISQNSTRFPGCVEKTSLECEIKKWFLFWLSLVPRLRRHLILPG